MRFTKDELRKAMLLYAVTDSAWLKEGQTLVQVTEDVLANGATFLQIREKEILTQANAQAEKILEQARKEADRIRAEADRQWKEREREYAWIADLMGSSEET